MPKAPHGSQQWKYRHHKNRLHGPTKSNGTPNESHQQRLHRQMHNPKRQARNTSSQQQSKMEQRCKIRI
jgi:hypothetical protein